MVASPLEALDGADALVIVTEWKCFHNPDFHAMAQRLDTALVLDGRNLYDPATLQELGVAYHGMAVTTRWACWRAGSGGLRAQVGQRRLVSAGVAV
jgi:UDPglucose 6-dehydrogenase